MSPPDRGSGTLVVVILPTARPADCEWSNDVKSPSISLPNVDRAQKFPRPIWPETFGPVYIQVKFSTLALSTGVMCGGVGPVIGELNVQFAGCEFVPATSPLKS